MQKIIYVAAISRKRTFNAIITSEFGKKPATDAGRLRPCGNAASANAVRIGRINYGPDVERAA